jgi:hypothetical protein
VAVLVITNGFALVNAVDLSNHVEKITVVDSADKLEITAMGATNKSYAKGLGDASITLDFFQDYAAASVYATLQPLKASTTPINVEVRPVNAARSTTNPAFVLANALMYTWQPLDAAVNTVVKMSVVFENATNTGLTYLTA